MDRIDQKLLTELQEDSRQPIAELSEKVALSPSACHRRIKLLEEKGVIRGYGARLDRKKIGYSIEFIIEVSLVSQREDTLSAFENAVKRMPEILECLLMTGQADYILRIAAADTADYEQFHRERLAQLPGVTRIHSSLVLRTVSRRTGYVVQTS